MVYLPPDVRNADPTGVRKGDCDKLSNGELLIHRSRVVRGDTFDPKEGSLSPFNPTNRGYGCFWVDARGQTHLEYSDNVEREVLTGMFSRDKIDRVLSQIEKTDREPHVRPRLVNADTCKPVQRTSVKRAHTGSPKHGNAVEKSTAPQKSSKRESPAIANPPKAKVREEEHRSCPDNEPSCGSVISFEFNPNDEERTTELLSKLFEEIQQLACKNILKAWIKQIEPGKQSKYPYCDKQPPPWWPKGLRHIEPDHLKKEERIALGMCMLRLRSNESWMDNVSEEQRNNYVQRLNGDGGWLPKLRECLKDLRHFQFEQDRDIRRERSAARFKIYNMMIRVAEIEEEYKLDEMDGDSDVTVSIEWEPLPTTRTSRRLAALNATKSSIKTEDSQMSDPVHSQEAQELDQDCAQDQTQSRKQISAQEETNKEPVQEPQQLSLAQNQQGDQWQQSNQSCGLSESSRQHDQLNVQQMEQPPSVGPEVKQPMIERAGRAEGMITIRYNSSMCWMAAYCYISEESGSLMCRQQDDNARYCTLIPDLRCCKVERKGGHSNQAVMISIHSQDSMSSIDLLVSKSEADIWFAALQYWQQELFKNAFSEVIRPQSPPTPSWKSLSNRQNPNLMALNRHRNSGLSPPMQLLALPDHHPGRKRPSTPGSPKQTSSVPKLAMNEDITSRRQSIQLMNADKSVKDGLNDPISENRNGRADMIAIPESPKGMETESGSLVSTSFPSHVKNALSDMLPSNQQQSRPIIWSGYTPYSYLGMQEQGVDSFSPHQTLTVYNYADQETTFPALAQSTSSLNSQASIIPPSQTDSSYKLSWPRWTFPSNANSTYGDNAYIHSINDMMSAASSTSSENTPIMTNSMMVPYSAATSRGIKSMPRVDPATTVMPDDGLSLQYSSSSSQ